MERRGRATQEWRNEAIAGAEYGQERSRHDVGDVLTDSGEGGGQSLLQNDGWEGADLTEDVLPECSVGASHCERDCPCRTEGGLHEPR